MTEKELIETLEQVELELSAVLQAFDIGKKTKQQKIDFLIRQIKWVRDNTRDALNTTPRKIKFPSRCS